MANDTAILDGMSLQLMPQQELACTSSDDWTGVIDRAQRRKLQNRLNQRAYRKRPSLPLAARLCQSKDP